ncbi:MAG: Maf-like protein [Motiliproteus sp.]|nr:Maf-like protein [Motiliproteus sp.]
MPKLILASHSPRRKELLEQIGVHFSTQGADIDETVRTGETPAQYVERLAVEKAAAVRARYGESKADDGIIVLGSDTSVVCDQHILGKPDDCGHAMAMLMQLSGRKHQVMTSIALLDGERTLSQVVTTEVFFRTLSETECQKYWHTGEPADKAGAYGIQGLGAVFVEHIEGSYSAVVGLPLMETAALLPQVGIPVWHPGD